ncbi:WecB/TagA/CpsF family glycosyltransferase [Poseidonocella sp. HB161398]|uniref:WecB/TagA/CpsF family glycosyltransferase n=1 Tax=Poseidonocella sp. HB161398 TaxID=2320855 RepID=UPI001F1175B8|nr:WecB/TagA/CpsF family glycosyltransferase [Poseidonocella sp. HB161398]
MTYASRLSADFPMPAAIAPALPASLGTARILDLDLVSDAGASVIAHLLRPGRRSRVAFVNAHCCNVRARDPGYADALETADLLLPDGIGVELAGRMQGLRLKENLNGTDFVPALLREAAERGMTVFLLGAAPGVARDAADRLCRDIPGLRIAGTRDGYEGMRDEADAIDEINRSGADIVLAALGVPFQDLWLARNARRLRARILMGVGALFDFLSGRVRRAPEALRKARLEWAWRLAGEPRRLARRYLAGNAAFLARAARHAAGRADRSEMVRRGLDIAIAGTALAAALPLGLLVAAAIRVESRGPVFFRQTRVGRDGRDFTMFKFRSMHADAEARRAALLAQSDREGICFKARHDPRITRVGRLLRRYSIDELPQILNVLRGEMSIVGPRPALPEEVAAYDGRARGRLAVRPGLTGLWQVSGRAEIGFDKMIDMDLAQISARSLLLDLLLIGMTARAVLGGRGAY